MISNEVALLIEQQRATHAVVKETYDLLQAHIKEDKTVAEIVTKHATYWGMTKWICASVVAVILGLLGLKK